MDTVAKMAREIERFLSWYTVTKAVIADEAALREALSNLFSKLADEIMNKLGDQLVAGPVQKRSIAQVIQDTRDKFKDVLFHYVKDAAESGAINAAEGVGVVLEKVSGGVLDLMKARVFEGADSTMDRVTGDVMDWLQEAYDQGMGMDEAARLLRDNVFDGLETWEAERIARTETHTAQGEAAHGVIDDNSDYRQWITAEDDRVRDSHADMHGEIVRSGDPYSNDLMYPGDMSGDIEEWINCRCVEVAFIMPAGMAAPEGLDHFTEDDLVEIDTAAEAA